MASKQSSSSGSKTGEEGLKQEETRLTLYTSATENVFQNYQQRVAKAVADIHEVGRGKSQAQQIRERQTKAIEELYKLFFGWDQTKQKHTTFFKKNGAAPMCGSGPGKLITDTRGAMQVAQAHGQSNEA